MQIIKKNLKEGKISLKIHTLDDLWHLQKILEPGDLVTAKTKRKTSIKKGQEIEEGERKPMILTLAMEKAELHKDMGNLRITGPIKAGPDDVQLSSYHTIGIKPGSELTVKKEHWKRYQLKRLTEAKTKDGMIFICLIDREQANFAELRESGTEMLGTVKAKKFAEDEKRDEYYGEVLGFIRKRGWSRDIIIAGPGFERENLFDYTKAREPELAKKMHLHYVSSVGKSGLNEVLKTCADKIITSSRIARETHYVEELFSKIKTDGAAAYGLKETEKAVEMGAVETLLVSEEKVGEFEKLMNRVERMGGEVVIISDDHESGEGFLHLGGIAALLRFRF